MATRVKKQATGTKEVALPQSSKNEAQASTNPKTTGRLQSVAGIAKKLGRKPKINTIAVKKTVLKAKAKVGRKPTLKINPKSFARVLVENGKGLEGKKILLKNGTKEAAKRGRKPKVPKIKIEHEEEPPPVLEPIFPQEENLEVKKTPKKRGRKPYKLLQQLMEMKKIKTEPIEEIVGTSEDPETPFLAEAPSPKLGRKPGRQRKPKPESSSIEEVMTDLSFLIDGDQIKKEVDDAGSESNKGDASKVKKLTKKQRLDLIKKDFTKKENIENTLSTLDPADAKVIDRLDLNVRKFKTGLPMVKRRHSIENFPTGSVDSGSDSLMAQYSLFNQLPRSLSPRNSKRGMRFGGKRSSPYSTRSDSPRMLRNGKHRRLKDVLLDGWENPRRRKRVHSDLSGSETASKLSGYESDSSFSDLASLHGSEKDSDISKSGTKDVDNLLLDDLSNLEPKTTSTCDLIKGNSSADLDKPLVDTNSNVCGDDTIDALEITLQATINKPEITKENTPVEDTPSAKVPEKGLLLDIMKQTFNDLNSDKSPPKCEVTKFYGRPCTSMEQGHELHQERRRDSFPSTQEMTDAATSTGDLSQRLDTRISEEDELRELLEQADAETIKGKTSHRKSSNLEDFPSEDKEAEEDASFENIVQGCIDSIGNMSPDSVNLFQQPVADRVVDEAPILEKQVITQDNLDMEKDDSIPVIDNMSAAILEPPQNLEHLDPPLLESSVLILEPQVVKPINKSDQKRSVIDHHNIGIAVTEKDNIVSFYVEHITDEEEEHDTSNEDVIQIAEEKNQSLKEGVIKSNAIAEDAEQILEAVPQPENAKEELEPQPELMEADEKTIPDISDTKMAPEAENTLVPLETKSQPSDIIINETICEPITNTKPMDSVEPPLDERADELEEMETEPIERSTDEPEDEQVTEKECDKPSETTDVENNETLDNSKTAENAADESPEELAQKESILNALGLQSLRAVNESPPKKKGKASTSKADGYTGTLKTVIKINKKKGKNSFKMTLQKNKGKSDADNSGGEEGYKIMKEAGSISWKHSKESSDTAGAHRKSHYSNRSNMEGSSEHTSDSEQACSSQDKPQPEKSLIVPEKASSFSIHPGRLCKDECSYCFGKFGLFDTPCHIAQMKSVERQNKILASEKHLTRDSCLCDACYRHVDRKSNSPSYINKSLKRNSLVAPGPRQNHCHVLGCDNVSTNILRRKWIIKMRKSICQVINIDLDNPGLHSIPICDEHFTALEHLMICAMCKRRLARNHIHYLGPEVMELNESLRDEGIPISLSDKPVVCKLCKCFASILLKDPEERMENSVNFFREYKKRLLHFNDIIPMDTAAAEEPIVVPGKCEKSGDKKDLEFDKRRKRMRNSSDESVHSGRDGQDEKDGHDKDMETGTRTRVPSTDTNNSQSANQSRAESPEDGDEYEGVDYNTLIPAIAMDCPSDNESKKDMPKKVANVQRKLPRLESYGNAVEISRTFKSSADRNRSNDLAAQKLGQNPSISLRPNYGGSDSWQNEPPSKLISNPAISVRQLFPGEEELGLAGDIDFKNVLTRTPEGWQKCTATIQYDEETKLLWQELQKPYGSKSSFLRHLILLEKYFRNGDLVLSPAASHHAINYRESVHNRLRAYDNIPSGAGNIQPPTMVQFNKIQARSSGGVTTQSGANGLPPVTISQLGRDNENQSSRTPITLQQLNQPPLFPTSSMLQNLASRSRATIAPPGLISINQRLAGPAAIRPQIPSQKIKFPITKNWRPNLIPIDPTKKNERKPGLVQVISGGKPYHITLEDYKKMCAIKRSFEAKQKKIQEQQLLAKQLGQPQQSILVSHNSVLRTVVPKKGLIISKTSGGTVTEGRPISLVPISNAPATITSGASLLNDSGETILEKLDKQVERLGQEHDPSSASALTLEKNPAIQIIPRIPKSLTVIPQTIRKGGPPSPVLYITPRSSSNGSSINDKGNGQP